MTDSEINVIRDKYNLLYPDELLEIRKNLDIDYPTADSLFGLNEGYYFLFENGVKLQSSPEDCLIRNTIINEKNDLRVLKNILRQKNK